MHELAVCQALIEQVQRVARANAARRIISITVSVGPLSGVEPQVEVGQPSAAICAFARASASRER